MNESMAIEYARRIVASIPGWSAESIVELTAEIQTWHNLPCAEAAVDELCRTWTHERRPTLGKVIEFYNGAMDVMRRREAMRLPTHRYDEPVCPPARGLEIARAAYEQEVRANARRPKGHPERVERSDDPDPAFFDAVIARALGRSTVAE